MADWTTASCFARLAANNLPSQLKAVLIFHKLFDFITPVLKVAGLLSLAAAAAKGRS